MRSYSIDVANKSSPDPSSPPRRVTIVDVAERAGVAISSVSTALNNRPGVSEQTRRRIQEAAAELGFVPSLRGKSLSGKRAYSVGLVVHRDPDVLELDPFFGAFIGGIESYLDSRDYALVLQMSTGADQALDRYRRLAADRRVDGVFVNELEVDDPRTQLVQDLGLPAVAINAGADFPLPSVRQEGASAVRDLIRELVDGGHRTIAHVAGPPRFVHAVERERAWRAALDEFGARPGVLVPGEFTYEGGIAAAEPIASDGESTAVFCANDLSAMGLIAELERRGIRVPDDVSVAGFDGIKLGELIDPTLSTIATSPRRVGYEAARVLLDVIDGRDPEDAVVPPAELVLRGSSASAP